MSNSFSSGRSPKSVVSRGFRGRRAADVDPARVPPGQYVTRDFPVLFHPAAGPYRPPRTNPKGRPGTSPTMHSPGR